MKIMLINPPISGKRGCLRHVDSLYPSLGLAYIAAVAENAGDEVGILDCIAMRYSSEDLYRLTKRYSPELVGMQAFIYNINDCLEAAKGIKELNPEIRIVLGGVQASLFPSQICKDENIDFVIAREGEIAFKNLLEAMEGKRRLADVDGLAWKENGDLRINRPQELIENLDILPFPAWHLFPLSRYHSSAQLRGSRTLCLITSRGCPYKCAYCAATKVFGRTSRHFSVDRIIKEIIQLKEGYKADAIQFYDDNFTIDRNKVINLCERLVKMKFDIPWSCFSRVDMIDRGLLKKMKEAGCYQIFYGVESGSQRLLNLIKKDVTLEQIREAVKITKEVGIEAMISLILGLPTETEEESQRTINIAIEIDADYAVWTPLGLFPGSDLFDMAIRHGRLIDSYGRDLVVDWDKLIRNNDFIYLSETMTLDNLNRMINRAYKRFYLRPIYLFKRLGSIMKLPFRKIFNIFRGGLELIFKGTK